MTEITAPSALKTTIVLSARVGESRFKLSPGETPDSFSATKLDGKIDVASADEVRALIADGVPEFWKLVGPIGFDLVHDLFHNNGAITSLQFDGREWKYEKGGLQFLPNILALPLLIRIIA